MIICPKCKAKNEPQRTTCHACGSNLLPGETLGSRMGCLVGGLLCGVVFIGIAIAFVKAMQEGGLSSILDLGLKTTGLLIVVGLYALGGLTFGLYQAFRRTPEYEKHAMRAARHVRDEPEQALADYARALELSPTEKLRVPYWEQRAKVYQELGRTEEARADLQSYIDHIDRTLPATKGQEHAKLLKKRGEILEQQGRFAEAAAQLESYLQAPGAEEGGQEFVQLLGGSAEAYKATGVKRTKGEIEKLRRQAVAEGELVAVGYCRRCRDAVEPTPDGKCPRCGKPVSNVEYLPPAARDAASERIRRQGTQTARKRKTLLIVGALVLVPLLVCCIAALLSSTSKRQPEPVTPSPVTSAAGPQTFQDNVFSFEYPGDWEVVDDSGVRTLLRTSLKGLTREGYSYIGGVYTGALDTRKGCASIVLVVLKDPSLQGTLTDNDYANVKASYEETMGSRLISIRQTTVSALPAVEIVHIGASRQSRIHSLMIVPQEKGLAYSVTCSAHVDDYEPFEPAFDAALSSLRIGTPGQEPQQRTYVVQSGDTLAKIAGKFGTTVEALVHANDISDPSLIRVGQVLIIP